MLLFAELEDVLGRPQLKDAIGQGATDRFLAGLLAIAEWAPDPEGAPEVSTRDPDDDYLVALAQSAEVETLVSGDRDLIDLPDPQLPIETPAQFWQRLG